MPGTANSAMAQALSTIGHFALMTLILALTLLKVTAPVAQRQELAAYLRDHVIRVSALSRGGGVVTRDSATPIAVTMTNNGTRRTHTTTRWSPSQERGWVTHSRVVGRLARAPLTVNGCQRAVCSHSTHAYTVRPIPTMSTARLIARSASEINRRVDCNFAVAIGPRALLDGTENRSCPLCDLQRASRPSLTFGVTAGRTSAIQIRRNWSVATGDVTSRVTASRLA